MKKLRLTGNNFKKQANSVFSKNLVHSREVQLYQINLHGVYKNLYVIGAMVSTL